MNYLSQVKIIGSHSNFKKHCGSWAGCTRCPLYQHATNHVLVRGRIPADVLFVGEAPGESEDVVGFPFIGRSGKLLDRIISEVSYVKFTYAITNTVACIPLEQNSNTGNWEKLRPPTEQEINACAPRVDELISLVKPKIIIRVGKVAAGPAYACEAAPEFNIFHPAYLLRKGGASPNNLDYKRTVIDLGDFLSKHFHLKRTRKVKNAN